MVAKEDIVYIPPPSIGHELGVMFGFIGASPRLFPSISGLAQADKSYLGLMLISFALYALAYHITNKKYQRREEDRLRALKAQGVIPDEKKKDGLISNGS